MEGGHGARAGHLNSETQHTFFLIVCREGECMCYILTICKYEDILVFLMVALGQENGQRGYPPPLPMEPVK